MTSTVDQRPFTNRYAFEQAKLGNFTPIAGLKNETKAYLAGTQIFKLNLERTNQLKERYPQATKGIDFFTVSSSMGEEHYTCSDRNESWCEFLFKDSFFLHRELQRYLDRDTSGFEPLSDAIGLHEVGHMRYNLRCKQLKIVSVVAYLVLVVALVLFPIYFTPQMPLTALIYSYIAVLLIALPTGLAIGYISNYLMTHYSYLLARHDEWCADHYALEHSTQLGLIYYIEYNQWVAQFYDSTKYDKRIDHHPNPAVIYKRGEEIYERRFGKKYHISDQHRKLFQSSFSIGCFNNRVYPYKKFKKQSNALKGIWEELVPKSELETFWKKMLPMRKLTPEEVQRLVKPTRLWENRNCTPMGR